MPTADTALAVAPDNTGTAAKSGSWPTPANYLARGGPPLARNPQESSQTSSAGSSRPLASVHSPRPTASRTHGPSNEIGVVVRPASGIDSPVSFTGSIRAQVCSSASEARVCQCTSNLDPYCRRNQALRRRRQRADSSAQSTGSLRNARLA